MKKVICAALTASMLVIPAVAKADALADARALNVCDVTGAEYLADGRLKVTCREGTVNPATTGTVAQPAVLGGTALGGGGIAAVVGGLLLLIVIAGDDDDASSSSSSSSSGS